MGLIDRIIDAFILAVGITPPQPSKRRKATLFIATGLVGTLVGIIAAFAFAMAHFSHSH